MKFIFPISFIVIAGILFFTIFNPTYNEVKQLKGEVASYNDALNSSTELQQIRDSLVGVYKNITTEDKDKLEHFLPDSIGNIELILEIEKMANSRGLPIKDFTFESNDSSTINPEEVAGTNNGVVVAGENPEDYLPYGIFSLGFTVEGDYNTFLLFLNDLEYNLRLVDIKSIDLMIPQEGTSTSDKKEVNPNIYSYKLNVNTYWLK